MGQQYFSEAERSVLVQSPLQAILAVTLADKTDPVSFFKDVQVGWQVIVTEQRQDITCDLKICLLAIARTLTEVGKETVGLGGGGDRERSVLKKLEQTLSYQV